MRRNSFARSIAARIACCAGMLALASGAASAKLDGPAWAQAEKSFQQLFAKPGDADLKLDLVKTLGTDGEPRAWKLLADGLMREAGYVVKSGEHLGKALNDLREILKTPTTTDGKVDAERDRIMSEITDLENAKEADEKVLDAIIAQLSSSDEAARKQVLALTKGHKDWPVRAAGARIAAIAPGEELATAVLAEALAAKEDARVKTTAIDSLSKAIGPPAPWQDLVIARLEDADWGVQLLAARLVAKRKLGRAIPTLIKALATAPPRVAQEVVSALQGITGQNIEAYAEPWGKWWEAHRGEWGEDGRPLQPVVSAPRPSDIKFYGVEIKSNKVLFIIDISGSMKEEKKPPPPPEKPKGPVTGDAKPPPEPDGKFMGPKIEIAKQELRRAISKLQKSDLFNIIAFNHLVTQWQPKMMTATEKNKEDALSWFRDLPPAGSTYVFGALQLAFMQAGMGAYDKAYPGVNVDTILLMSDGAPTDNSFPESKLMPPEDILAKVREWNPQKRVIINCIGIDNVVIGIKFMKDLAAQNGGFYIDG